MAWNPLHDDLLTSSVLANGPDVIAVWALLLASADRAGVSRVTVPALASLMRISEDRVDVAIRILESPDKRSKSKRAQGRRIQPLEDGGWMLVNHDLYRKRAEKEASAERMARMRAKRAALAGESEKVRVGGYMACECGEPATEQAAGGFYCVDCCAKQAS